MIQIEYRLICNFICFFYCFREISNLIPGQNYLRFSVFCEYPKILQLREK